MSADLPRPVVDRVRRRGYDDRADELVVPALALLVPQHPEVAEQARDRRDPAAEVADHRAAEPDRAAGVEVDHADPERALGDRLARAAALEVAEVADPDRDPDDAGEI